LVFSIPYTTVLLLGLRLVPKAGFATLLILGQGLFGQLLGRGINPAWWPYYLWCGLSVEILLLLAGHHRNSLPVMLATGLLRGLIAYTYMYLVLAPFLWQQFYAPWYIALKTLMGLVGCALGAMFAWRVAPRVEKASRLSSV
jgi:ABC-type thiamin/hydroxymethylpyrimidine transport system permease subunit